MKHELKRGQALVITGPKGCGKSTLAREIAEQHGSFVEVDAHQLNEHFGISEALASKPNTLIVDKVTAQHFAKIKALIVSDSVRVHRKNQPIEIVDAPHFIFCSGDANPFVVADGDRRFLVVSLSGELPKPEPSTMQLSIALAKLYSGGGPGDDMWCELDYQALEFALGYPVERKPIGVLLAGE